MFSGEDLIVEWFKGGKRAAYYEAEELGSIWRSLYGWGWFLNCMDCEGVRAGSETGFWRKKCLRSPYKKIESRP